MATDIPQSSVNGTRGHSGGIVSIYTGLFFLLQVLCFGSICVLYSTVCLLVFPTPSHPARLRCGTDLLADLIFVCGERGIYLGKGNWSGYGTRRRGKGIVDHCCQSAGCDLQHLEMYCAKAKDLPQQHTTPQPISPAPNGSQASVEQQFEVVFQKRLTEHLGPPNSQKRKNYRRKSQNVLKRKKPASPSRRLPTQQPTSRPSPVSQSPLRGFTTLT
ncbi:insulin-like growth factor 3 [Lampris incognitus]|uniref:insulin-like growth factor 3 n=1 Tax=Lampris incognitus TaxID=2546036 RepID=UPI0024B50B08|nr:insulin-like growth factor 3 [Lampris incognitus]